jgi:hypothetical protein
MKNKKFQIFFCVIEDHTYHSYQKIIQEELTSVNRKKFYHIINVFFKL